MTVGALWPPDALSGWEAAPMALALPRLDGGERRRRCRLPRGAGPQGEFGVRDSGKAFCGRATGSPAVTRGVAASSLPPSPSHPSGSSNVGPKSLGPTTTNRRHRFRDVSVGAGVGGSTRRGSRGPRAFTRLPAGTAHGGINSPTRSAAWTNQRPASGRSQGDWTRPWFKSEGGSWRRALKVLGVTGT